MPGDVGQRLGGHPVDGDLERGRQGRQRVGVDADVQPAAVAAVRQLLHPLPQRLDEAELVEHRGPELVDHAADAVDGSACFDLGTPHQLVGPLGVGVAQVDRGIGRERQPGQPRAESVVQLAPEPASLLLHRGDLAFAGDLQLLAQRGGVHRE